MDEWKYTPARDLGMSEHDRLRSLKRESGLVGMITRNCWWWAVRAYLATCQRVRIEGRENLPDAAPFMLVANHASHFDGPVLATALPLKLRNVVFPIAAGDTFFETPVMTAFSAGMMNALPMWRKNAGHHAMEQLRQRLIEDPCGYILFPEGTRTRTGEMGSFRAGVGMLIAGSPVPVIPCHLDGTYYAWPATRKFPRGSRITLRIGKPLSFAESSNTRDGWNDVAQKLEAAVRALGGDQPKRPVT
jgi:1-acyl-sn-glycerol-3-phosphate acyltransferase